MVGPLVECTFEGSTYSDVALHVANIITLLLCCSMGQKGLFLCCVLTFLEAYCEYMVYDAVGDRQEAFH